MFLKNLPFLSIVTQPFLIINKIIILTLLIIPKERSSLLAITIPSPPSSPANNYPNQYNNNQQTSYDNPANGVDADSSELLVINNYSDEEYYQLSGEYEDNLRASFAVKEEEKNAEQREKEVSADEQANQHKKEESWDEMGSRLKCDNPWFWNAPKCTWIDVKTRHVISRTRRNAEKSAWFLGSILGFFFVGFCTMYCYYRAKIKNRLKMLKLREKYAPGKIQLPNGEIAEYAATEEENKAYEELVKAIIIQELVSVI